MNTQFPLEVLPEPVRSYVADGARAIGCDPSYVALPMLSALASVIGNARSVLLKRSWTEPSILWTVIVGESGTSKSPAFDLALKPVRRIQSRMLNQHTQELASWKPEHAEWERACKRLPPTQDRPAEPERPVCQRVLTDDATVESIAPLLQDNPRGLLLARDELSGWFHFGRYNGGQAGGDVARWLEMYGGRMLTVDRRTSDPIFVPRASLSITGGIQPAVLRRALGQQHRENGLCARFLLAWPPRIPKRWSEADVSAELEESVFRVFERLYGLEPGTDERGCPSPRAVVLTSEAKELWVSFVNDHALEQAELSGDEAAAWSKLECYGARISLVLCLASWAGSDRLRMEPVGIDARSMSNAINLVRWFANEARRIYAMIDESEEDAELRRVREWIEGRGGTATPRELVQHVRSFRKRTDDAKAVFARLVESGIAEWVIDSARVGRPSEKIRIARDANVYEILTSTG